MIDRLLQLYAHTPEHPCKLRVFGLLCRALKRGRPLELTVADGLRLRLNPFDHVDRALVLTDWHERLTTRFLRRNLRPGDTALIAGAHMGYHVLNAALAVGPSGRVIGCEPVPASRRRALEHIARNGCAAQSQVLDVALGDHCGIARMSAPPADNTGAAQLGSATDGLINVPLRTIEAVLAETATARLGFLLLDVEGCELRALAGIGAHRPRLMVIECDPRLLRAAGEEPDQLIARLRELGYSLHTLGGAPVSRADYYPEANLVAVHETAPAPEWA